MENTVVTRIDELAPTLSRLRDSWQARKPDYAQRRDDLTRLRAAFKGKLDAMASAVSEDFGGRSKHESLI
ncbi:MAG: coniferyl aldehyde dehydrogenase, partial [Thermomonas sp.]